MMFFLYALYQSHKKEQLINAYLEIDDLIYEDIDNLENTNIIEHDVSILQNKLQEQIDNNQDMQDFVMKWCHEIKIPLSASLLMIEKIENEKDKNQLREQLEKINQSLNFALVSCKAQSSLYDLQIKKISLKECINASIRNNRFFLIHNHAKIQINIHDEYIYSDQEWIVYIIDQLIINAIKYADDNLEIHIWCEVLNNTVQLFIKDFGEGIKDYDLPRIFERGYVGSNHHNGKYKSTGMGLYMVKLMINRLGHTISVESCYQKYTCFNITFQNIEKHFNL